MREIKFRGKSTIGAEWIYGLPSVGFPKEKMEIIDKDGFGGSVEENTVGQWTGLTDKDGKEIYEGDIVAFKWLDTGVNPAQWRHARVVVAFQNGAFTAERPLWQAAGDTLCCLANIYDNPELVGR